MAKQRLFPEPTSTSQSDDPTQRFDALASKVLAVSKSEIDKREKQWRKAKLRREK